MSKTIVTHRNEFPINKNDSDNGIIYKYFCFYLLLLMILLFPVQKQVT